MEVEPPGERLDSVRAGEEQPVKPREVRDCRIQCGKRERLRCLQGRNEHRIQAPCTQLLGKLGALLRGTCDENVDRGRHPFKGSVAQSHFPILASLQEFTVESYNVSAEFGRFMARAGNQ